MSQTIGARKAYINKLDEAEKFIVYKSLYKAFLFPLWARVGFCLSSLVYMGESLSKYRLYMMIL